MDAFPVLAMGARRNSPSSPPPISPRIAVAHELGSPQLAPVTQGVLVGELPLNASVEPPAVGVITGSGTVPSDTDSDRTTLNRPSTGPAIAIPVGPYADLGVETPHVVEPVDAYTPSQQLLGSSSRLRFLALRRDET